MRLLSLIAAIAMLVLALPAAIGAVEEEEPVSEPCTQEQVDAADFVATVDGLTTTIATPMMPSPYPLGVGGEPDPAGFQEAATEVYTILLDVNPDHLSAVADVTLTWDHRGDIDMDIYKNGNLAGESHDSNLLQEAGDINLEYASAGRVDHCETFEVHIRNYISQPGDINLFVGTTNLRDF